MEQAAIALTRAFNRTAAERIGALTDRFLGRARPLGETRALWEIGPDGLEVRTLRARLGLDSGYASRVLRALERQGLVAVTASPDDGRVRCACLTEAGLARSTGWWAEGPIENADDLQPALQRAAAQVKNGKPALVDAVTQHR